MDYVDCLILGGKSVGKHSLIDGFQEAGTSLDEVSLALTIDKKNVDFVVKLVDETTDNKMRRIMYLKADVVILGYSHSDPESLQAVKSLWMPELHIHAANVPVLLMGTKFDLLTTEQQEKAKAKGDKVAKELGCIGFQEASSVSADNIQLFERAVLAGLAKKAQQRSELVVKPKKRSCFSFGRQRSTGANDSQLQDFEPAVTRAVSRITGPKIEYAYAWRGELICTLVEDLLDGTVEYSRSWRDHNLNENIDLDTVTRAVGEIAKKLLIFYHFLPVSFGFLENHNMQFWLEVEDLKHNPSLIKRTSKKKKLKQKAIQIYQEYITPTSPKEIHIEDDVRNDITIKLNGVPSNRVFDLAQVHTLAQLANLFKENFLQSHTNKALLHALKSMLPIIPSILRDSELDGIPLPTGDSLSHMLSQCVHVMGLMELLHSGHSADKRPAQAQFLKLEEEERVVKTAIKYLLLFSALKTHINKEKSTENLLFWLDAEDFRSMDFGPWKDDDQEHEKQVKRILSVRAAHIVRCYIEDDSDLLINLPGQLTKQIKISLAELQEMAKSPASKKADEALARLQHMFDGAQREILLLMKRDSWRRFQASAEAQEMRQLMDKLLSHEEFEDPEKVQQEQQLHNRFDLMSDEMLLRTFSCALEKKMLLHGQMFVTKRHLCFFSNIFGMKTKFCHNFSEIASISREEEDVTKKRALNTGDQGLVITLTDGSTLVFRQISPSRSKLMYVLKKARQRLEKGHEEVAAPVAQSAPDAEGDDDDQDNTQGMKETDWEIFKEGAEIKEYKSRGVVLAEGMAAGNIYQIARGACSIEKSTAAGPIALRTCKAGEIIGEISFVEGGTTSAAVIATTDDVVMYIMSREFIDNALIKYPGLSGRFYKFLATLLAERLRTKVYVSDTPPPSNATLTDTQFRSVFGLKDESATILKSWEGAVRDKALMMYGRIYLSQTVICFHSRVLGSVKKLLIPISDVTQVNSQKNLLRIFQKAISTKAEFYQVENCDQARELIRAQTTAFSRDRLVYAGSHSDDTDEIDWDLFLSGAELKLFNKDEVVLEEGTSTRFVYQLGHGIIRVQKNNKIFRELNPGEIFGEMSFLQDYPVSASIVAAKNNTMVYIIEKKFVDSLLELNPELPGRFYKFLATLLATRLRD